MLTLEIPYFFFLKLTTPPISGNFLLCVKLWKLHISICMDKYFCSSSPFPLWLVVAPLLSEVDQSKKKNASVDVIHQQLLIHSVTSAAAAIATCNYIRTQNRTLKKWTGIDGSIYLEDTNKIFWKVQMRSPLQKYKFDLNLDLSWAANVNRLEYPNTIVPFLHI